MSILTDIVEVKKDEVKKLKNRYTLNSFNDFLFFGEKSKSLREALNFKDRLSIIAEIKKASPSKGILKENFNHLEIAYAYQKCNVEAVSILTDKNFFMGDINYLSDIKKITSVPLLRKDFIIDEYQVYEAKAYGADAVLLICEILSKAQIQELTLASYEIGLEVLLEFHGKSEIDKIDFALNKIIGINNRDLMTFNVDINKAVEIASSLPDDINIVAESGIKDKNDIALMKNTKINGLLIGELFMKTPNIEENVNLIKEACLIEN